jgi:DNA (cytosine-5)-methyltransferase 1
MARRVTLTQMGYGVLNHPASESESLHEHDHDVPVYETETMPLIDLLGQDSGSANQPVVIDDEGEVEDIEESELIALGKELTQDCINEYFNELEEESKREQQSEEEPSPKRPRITEQPTIDGYLLAKSDISPNKQSPIAKDSCYLNGKLFKEGETFSLLGEKGKGIYVTIDTIMTKKLQYRVVSGTGGVSIVLEQTFIGEESKRLLQAKSWREQNPKNPDRALYANRSTLFSLGTMPLKNLAFKVENLTERPKPALVYDCGPKISRGVDFNIAYRRDSRRSHKKRELPRKPAALDMFAGCGGMGRGLKAAGFHCKYHVEKDPSAVATLRCNHRVDDEEAIIFEEDVNLFLQKVQDKKPAYPQMGDVDHVHASPPCQGFSSANRNGGRNDKTNNALTKTFTRAVELFRPRTASMENVTGILSDKNDNIDHLKWVVAELMILGYQVRVTILNSAEFGDPQNRIRVILFAAQNAYKLPDAPKPTHGEKGKAIVTVKDVLHDLESVKPELGSGMVVLPNGKVVEHHNEEGTDLAEMALLNKNKPAATVRKTNGMQHYALPRGVTVRERARIQSFPDHYLFCGKPTERNDQIGNAVPFNLARAVASSIMKSHTLEAANDSGL